VSGGKETGETMEEAIALHTAGLIEEGKPVPEEPEPLQALTIRVAA
jgi:predicted RNase H-like HicB family nuclease